MKVKMGRKTQKPGGAMETPRWLLHLPKLATLCFALFALYLLPFSLLPAWNEARLSKRILKGQQQKFQNLQKDWDLKRRQLFGLRNDPQAWIRALDDKGVPPPSFILPHSQGR